MAAAGASSDGETQVLSRQETAQLGEDEFFEAYQQGKVARRDDHLTEENWEEVRLATIAVASE